jgi:Holliday junction resolvase RusA-like endonuclease
MTELPGFVVHGPPRTKKTHNRVVNIPFKGSSRCRACGRIPGTPRVLPSEQYELWEKSALAQSFGIKDGLKRAGVNLPIASLVNINAQVYREANIGDLAGYLQAIGDMLQKAGILLNDSQIDGWDGSRRQKDATNPRVEIFITVLVERSVQQALQL